MFDRNSHKLLGNVRRVTSEFASLRLIGEQYVPEYGYTCNFLLFDADGRLLEEMSLEREQMDGVYRDVYEYDSEGNLIERIEYNFDGDVTGKTVFDTTENGFRIERHSYVTKSGSFLLSSEQTFDQNSNLMETVRFDSEGRVEGRRNSYGSNREEETRTSVDDGYIIEMRRYDKNDQLSLRTLTRYDQRGIHKEFSCFEPDGTMYLQDGYEHDYDSAGNWIREVQSHWVTGWGEFRLVPFTVTSRQIEYFEN